MSDNAIGLDDLGSLVRHGLTAGAGILVTNGVLTGSQAQDLVAGLMVVLALLWSAYQKRQQRKVVQVALFSPVPLSVPTPTPIAQAIANGQSPLPTK
jgi:hypothetical protein